MLSKFARRQNTDLWWRSNLNSLIDRGRELGGRGRETFESLDDLKAHHADIQHWLMSVASQIRRIYADPALADQYDCSGEEIDFNNQSWSDIIVTLKTLVEERLRKLKILIESTPS